MGGVLKGGPASGGINENDVFMSGGGGGGGRREDLQQTKFGRSHRLNLLGKRLLSITQQVFQ